MKKVLIFHGFGGAPNGGWRPWLMSELDKEDIWAASFPMPDPDAPILQEWIRTIESCVDEHAEDELYLVGHSLGSTVILRYLESTSRAFAGVVLVSGPIEDLGRTELAPFLDHSFDFKTIKAKAKQFTVIHGDTDDRVPLAHAKILAEALGCVLMIVPNGGHLNGRSGWHALPQCLDTLKNMFNNA